MWKQKYEYDLGRNMRIKLSHKTDTKIVRLFLTILPSWILIVLYSSFFDSFVKNYM
jgi:hypothetical protein